MADTKKKKRASLSLVHYFADHPGGALRSLLLSWLPAASRASRAPRSPGRAHRAVSASSTPLACLFVRSSAVSSVSSPRPCARCRIAALVHKLKGNELVLIPILMFIFSIGGTTYGMCEENVLLPAACSPPPWWPPVDSLTGAAVVLWAPACGVLGSIRNLFAGRGLSMRSPVSALPSTRASSSRSALFSAHDDDHLHHS